MTIKYIQEQLDVVADGLWGNLSHTALTQALQQGKVIKASNNFTVSNSSMAQSYPTNKFDLTTKVPSVMFVVA